MILSELVRQLTTLVLNGTNLNTPVRIVTHFGIDGTKHWDLTKVRNDMQVGELVLDSTRRDPPLFNSDKEIPTPTEERYGWVDKEIAKYKWVDKELVKRIILELLK